MILMLNFVMTTAKVSGCKALAKLLMLLGMTYVVDQACNDYSLNKQGSRFVGRMKSSAKYDDVETREAQGEGMIGG